ncbi:MAG: winged helix-turn-helix transcriptional regulator [Tissierellia bacterium]|nr:winged helix-turn-helix transcriptional regulator [Tissierellia bacterium]
MTQKELGNVIGAAPSMVNVYIKELEEQNYLNRDTYPLKQ